MMNIDSEVVLQPGPNGHIAEDNLRKLHRMAIVIKYYAISAGIRYAALRVCPEATRLKIVIGDDDDGDLNIDYIAWYDAYGVRIGYLTSGDYWDNPDAYDNGPYSVINDFLRDLRSYNGDEFTVNLRAESEICGPGAIDRGVALQLLGQLGSVPIWTE